MEFTRLEESTRPHEVMHVSRLRDSTTDKTLRFLNSRDEIFSSFSFAVTSGFIVPAQRSALRNVCLCLMSHDGRNMGKDAPRGLVEQLLIGESSGRRLLKWCKVVKVSDIQSSINRSVLASEDWDHFLFKILEYQEQFTKYD
ncbi:hypothetical protein AVEN_210085-1 [Araneus ventricosus]|uniref:Uncharacterized protein n=1 Tax=Araneus ventricosus TaxID=182803 RepID=A0A4Y2NVJ0_ARAVE|nr:hypothetical protein AVEN_210085-1 [Araneus ventricosus]